MLRNKTMLDEYRIYLTKLLVYDLEDLIDIDVLGFRDFINKSEI